jgi:hypothetical protein
MKHKKHPAPVGCFFLDEQISEMKKAESMHSPWKSTKIGDDTHSENKTIDTFN